MGRARYPRIDPRPPRPGAGRSPSVSRFDRFGGAEDVLDHPALAVAQGGLQRGEPGIGAQHIGAVEQRVERDAARVDLKAAAGGKLDPTSAVSI